MGWVCSTHEELKNACKILVGKFKVKKHLRRLRFISEADFKMCLKEVGLVNACWIHLSQDKDHCLNIRVP